MLFHSRKKAQTPILENVMLFAIGIIIFIVFVSVFYMYQNHFLLETATNQLEELNSFITSSVIEVALRDVAEATVTIQIPKLIGAERYEVRADSNGINITTLNTRKSSFSPVFNITENFDIAGDRILSRRGRIIINKQGNKIIIE